MTDAPLPPWAARARTAASFAFSVFGLVLIVRYVVLVGSVLVGDGSWGDTAPPWLQIPAATAVGLAALLALVRLAGEVVAGTRTPRP
ncbi:hypothetical protein AERO_01960 [Aeromicrobium fastidiosum]|uniref:hypothetical protein n=1 Tax=Aeromicrobium fastidiosum TaxID=52699 RepID=UPI0020234C32|nr:hypothetical protein [Aeromicrobium fastidiosum]MCL8250135.1 hypothetical protein [Aeromicrobium fastidiosum]